MICPQCRAEYRQGFTRCADCDVELLSSLRGTAAQRGDDNPESDNTSTAASDEDDPYCIFWEGEDTRVFAEVCGVLDEEGIAYRALRHDSQIFRINPNSKMRIGVPFSLFDRAELAVVDAFGGATEARKLPWPTEDDKR
jgi:hypothetical protein